MELADSAKPLEGNSPSGENLEYDPLYMEMDSLAESVPDSQIGDAIRAGRDANWKALAKNCSELWKRTRDLRVAAYWTIAETCGGGGMASLRDGLRLIFFLIDSMWDSFWPQLDPEDGNDPTERINIMAMLSPDFSVANDPVQFIANFRKTRLVPSAHWTIRDMLIASCDLKVEGEYVDPALLSVEIAGTGDAVATQAAVAAETSELIAKICAAAEAKMAEAGGFALRMDALALELKRIVKFFDGLTTTGGGTANGGTASEAVEAPAAGGIAVPAGFAPPAAGGRDAAIAMLRTAGDWFRRNEPGSPVPYLVDRAVRLSQMNFMEVLQDMLPDSLGRGRDILGVKNGNNNE